MVYFFMAFIKSRFKILKASYISGSLLENKGNDSCLFTVTLEMSLSFKPPAQRHLNQL